MDKSGPKAGGAPGSTGSAKNSMTPGFQGGAGGGEKTAGLSASSASARNEKGAATLGAGEAVAAGAVSSDSDTGEDLLDETREGEENAEGYYSGNGGEDGEEERNVFALKKGPIATLIGIIIAIAGISGAAQLSQPFSLVEQFRTTFNSMQTSVSTRSNTMVKYQIDNGLMRNPTKAKLFGGQRFNLSNKQKNKLASKGIEYDDNFEGTGKGVLKYDDGSGNMKYIVADTKDIADLDGKVNGELMTIKTAFDTDAGFFEAYKSGSLTWRGAIANWFETATAKFFTENKLTRNLFNDFRQKVEEGGGSVKATAQDLIAKGTDEVTDGGAKRATSKELQPDERDPNIRNQIDTEEVAPQSKISTDFKSEAEVGEVLNTNIKQKVDGDAGGGISGVVQTSVSAVCAVGDTIGAISLLVTGVEALQIIHLITSYMEAIDKVKAGDGNDSPINELTTTLNEKKQNKHVDFDDVEVNAIDPSLINANADVGLNEDQMKGVIEQMESNAESLKDVKTTTTDKTAMESSGITALYSGGKVNPYDESVKSFNFSGSIKRIVGGLGVSLFSFNTCSIAKIVANGVGVAEGVWQIGKCVLGIIGIAVSYGASSTLCAGLVMNVASSIALGAAITGLISAVVSALVPFVAGILTRNLIAELGGEDLGNALTSGANMYMGNVHRYNGGSLSNASTYTQFALEQQKVIAEDAEYERMRRSPFDASSQYTFMGALMRQLMNFVGTSSVMSAIMSSSNIISSSIASLSPMAAAVDVANSLVDNYEDVCPYLDSIGAVGDAYCNPYAVTDMNTITEDPSVVVDKIKDNLEIVTMDENGNESVAGCVMGSDGDDACPDNIIEQSNDGGSGIKIKGNSDLAKYILYCDQRSSAFGIMDANIANELSDWANVKTNNSKIDSVANGAIGGVPALGDLVDVVNNAQKLANYGYIFGESCVAGNDVQEGDVEIEDLSGEQTFNKTVSMASPNWNKAQYYQRFIEDQSLMESMGIIEKSAVTAFIEDYRKEHPLDNSYAGVLARYSGLTKDNVIALLDAIDYATYIAEYDPTTRYAFSQEVKPEGADELKFDNDQKVAYVVLLNTIEFADVRNRNFVV